MLLKRNYYPFMVVLLGLSLLVAFIGCTNTTSPNHVCDFSLPTIDPVLEEQIIQDFRLYWYNLYGTEIGCGYLTPLNYLGTHNNYVVFLVSMGDLIVSKFMISGSIFRLGMDLTIYLWNDDSLFEMVDAYRQGDISPENIKEICEIFKKKIYGCLCMVPDWYYDEDDLSTIIP